MIRKLTAIVIGNNSYPGAVLNNPINDAKDISEKLQNFGFSVILLTDATNKEMGQSMKLFSDNLNRSDVGLFYFAGHGMQIEGENYITFIDTEFDTEIDAKYSSYALNKVIDIMEKGENSTNIIILDACRNNPYERSWSRNSKQIGLAPIFAPKGTIIAFSTSPGEFASDGTGRNGSYTESLLTHIDTHDINIEEMFKRVRNTLAAKTENKQTSWEHTSLLGDFYFNLGVAGLSDIYSREAITDELFSFSDDNPIHKIIKNLKIYDWYTQNPALKGIKISDLNEVDINTALVLGRNIYQAACGASDAAWKYLKEFRTKTSGVNSEIKKSIFDGILLEIFINSKGELRENFKSALFELVFSYQKFSEFDDSFKFISDLLTNFSSQFYIIPGKQRNISINIITEENDKKEFIIKSILLEGNNILRRNGDGLASNSFLNDSFEPLKKKGLHERICEELMIAEEKMTIVYDISCDDSTKFLFPYSTSLRKN